MRGARQRRQARSTSTETKPENRNSQSSKDTLPPEDEQVAEGTVGNFAKELEIKDAQLNDLNDKTLRLLAEMQNVRMIARRDVENAKIHAITPFEKGLLNAAENLGLALNAVRRSELTNEETNAKQLAGLVTGVDATEAELLKIISQHGIHRFDDVGDKFDPTKYQAIYEAPSPDFEPGTVISVTKLGYKIGNRVLRPAEVEVSRPSSSLFGGAIGVTLPDNRGLECGTSWSMLDSVLKHQVIPAAMGLNHPDMARCADAMWYYPESLRGSL